VPKTPWLNWEVGLKEIRNVKMLNSPKRTAWKFS